MKSRKIYCDFCRNLNVTEIEQQRIRQQGTLIPHFCKVYNSRVYHESTENGLTREPIKPCLQCVADGFDNYLQV